MLAVIVAFFVFMALVTLSCAIVMTVFLFCVELWTGPDNTAQVQYPKGGGHAEEEGARR